MRNWHPEDLPVNMLDPIWKCLVTNSYGQNQARLYMPDLTSRIQFGSVFPKKAWIMLCKTDPDLSGWPGPVLGKGICPEASWHAIKKSWGLVPSRTQPGCCQFPTVRLSCLLQQVAWIILCKTSLDLIGFWLTVSGLGQMDLLVSG